MSGPLAQKRVIVTRPEHQAQELVQALEAAGAVALCLPVLVVVPVTGAALVALDTLLALLVDGAYDGVLFTSSNAVALVHERLVAHGEAAALERTPAFAIGEGTARALAERGVVASSVAAEATSEGLLAALVETFPRLDEQRFFLPRAAEGRDVLIEGLRDRGARVDVTSVYETRPVTDGPALPEGAVDWVTFASPSAVRAYVARFGTPAARVACLGPVTATEAERIGVHVDVVASEATMVGLVQAMERV